MDYQNLILTKENYIAIITINNPKTLNALNTSVLKDLDKVFDDLREENDLRAVILTGAGRSFVAGADISEMAEMNEEQGKEFGKFGSDIFRKIETFPKPVIAAVNGFALGGGCELAMACDFRIASEDAKLGQPEVGLGITPGFSGTLRLPRLVGMGMAKELIYSGNVVNAKEALRIGLVNRVFPTEDLMAATLKIAEMIAKRAPIAVEYSKKVLDKSIDIDIDKGIALENDYFGKCFSTEDQKDGMRAFVAKGKVEYKGK